MPGAQRRNHTHIRLKCKFVATHTKIHSHELLLELCGLIHLDNTVDLTYEPKAREEPDGAGQQEEEEYHNGRVAEIQERRGTVLDRKLCDEVVAAVYEQIDCCEAGRQEGAPPPVIVLRTQVKVAQQNGGLRACDDQYDKDQEQKTEHVVNLAGPQRTQDKEQLNEDAAKG